MKIQNKFKRVLFLSIVVLAACTDDVGVKIPTAPEEIDLTNSIFFEVDLTDRSNDTFKVRMFVDNLTPDNAIIQFAATVPGTYDIFDIGRFVSNFKVYDENYKELEFTHLSVNQWQLTDPENTSIIEYEVKETFDTPVTEHSIYKMAGTSLENDHTLLNAFDVLCYPTGLKEHDFYLDIDYPSSWTVGTSLEKQDGFYYATDFDKFVDSPLLLGSVTSAATTVAGTDVGVYTYSKTRLIQSSRILDDVNVVLADANAFLNGLPADRYNFLFLLDEFSSGALEHSYSSVYVLFEQPYTAAYGQSIRNITAHEFFHVVTPLNIHSEIIEDFNFADPTPSEHLWLYEGMTEWAAHMMQFRNNHITTATLLDRFANKKANADWYNVNNLGPMSLSQMSLTCYAEGGAQFNNVYNKGALVAALLDIQLLDLSNGSKGLREVILELIDTYGPENSFSEDDFFNDFADITGYPTEVTDFLNKYVKGTVALPMVEYFEKIGITYDPSTNTFFINFVGSGATAEQVALREKWSVNF
ncbi:MAG: peptidase [Cyclobacteriaceae bacterium]